jgi:hypothetical protein
MQQYGKNERKDTKRIPLVYASPVSKQQKPATVHSSN